MRTGYPFLDDALFIAMAHRGGAGHPELAGWENTLRGFRHAVSLGYRYLETDVHATRDGVLVAFHDEILDRVSDGTGRICELTGADVARASIRGETVPLMSELLEELPDIRFNIDVKSPTAVAPLAELVARMGCQDRVLVGSFGVRRLREFRRLTRGSVATSATPPEVAAFRLLPGGRVARTALGRNGPQALQVPYRRGRLTVVTRGFVARAHAAGLKVHVWTVDEPSQMHELIDLGVDGLITDRTDLLRDVLVARGLWEVTR